MPRRPGLVLLLFVSCYLLRVPACTQLQAEAQAQPREEQPQPEATQGGITTSELDAQPKFDMDYFVGVWTFESTMSSSPLGTGGPMMGSETVRNVWDGRFWDVKVEGKGA